MKSSPDTGFLHMLSHHVKELLSHISAEWKLPERLHRQYVVNRSCMALEDITSPRQRRAVDALFRRHFGLPRDSVIPFEVCGMEKLGGLTWVNLCARLPERSYEFHVIIPNASGSVDFGEGFYSDKWRRKALGQLPEPPVPPPVCQCDAIPFVSCDLHQRGQKQEVDSKNMISSQHNWRT